MSGRLVTVGSVIVDVTLHVPRLPERGGDVLGRDGHVTPGGSFNVMVAARRQGAAVAYAGTHGHGPFGDLVRSSLTGAGIEVLQPAGSDADTGFDVAVTDDDGERTFLTHLGAESALTPALLAHVQPMADDVVYVSGYVLARPGPAQALVAWLPALDDDVVVVVDPGPLVAQLPAAELDALRSRADWWSCSTAEAAASEPSGRRGVVVRDGARGAVLTERGRPGEVLPAPVVEVVDTNGAGDAHVGVFAAALLAGLEPREAVERANVAAALAVTRRGPATSPTGAETDWFRPPQPP